MRSAYVRIRYTSHTDRVARETDEAASCIIPTQEKDRMKQNDAKIGIEKGKQENI